MNGFPPSRQTRAPANRGYPRSMGDKGPARRVAPVPRPADLVRFAGLWVALLDGEVVAAEPTSHTLALRLHDMDHHKRSQLVVEYVRPTGDSYIVGVG